ncbi:hypothetical protein [Pseudonocardia sp. DLS-67]
MPEDAVTPAIRLPTAKIGLVTKVARMYHEQGIRQPEIAARLSMSQSRVSRLLKEAVDLGVVRTVEETVRTAYGLSDVVVADVTAEDDTPVLSAPGALWDRRTGEAVGPLLGWQDRRTAGACVELAATGAGDLVRTGDRPAGEAVHRLRARHAGQRGRVRRLPQAVSAGHGVSSGARAWSIASRVFIAAA